MSPTEGLVPITRAFLASYYDKHPFTPLSDDVPALSSKLRSISSDLLSRLPVAQDERDLVEESDHLSPHKIDDNMWKNREHIEEIIFLLDRSCRPPALRQQSNPEFAELDTLFDQIRDKFQLTLNTLMSFLIMTYLPQDFRGTLIRQQRERSERNKQAEVDALINSGAFIRERYALLWKQQMDRRRQLAQLGSATGVYKTLVKYLVGVPQVLLDFIKRINDDDGERDEIAVLEQAVNVYASEFERFVTFLSEVFTNSPFFISAEEAGTIQARNNDDLKEISIPAGKTYEVSLSVDSLNSYIAWDFSLIQGKVNMDIGFSVECVNSSGEKSMILPYRRYGADQGNFCTCVAGDYKLIWDNSYSNFFRKAMRYKVDCIPPVVEPVQSL